MKNEKVFGMIFAKVYQIRYLDKLVDELAKGKKMDEILRK